MHLVRLVKEMCLEVKGLDFTWVQRSFYHMLSSALSALSLQDI